MFRWLAGFAAAGAVGWASFLALQASPPPGATPRSIEAVASRPTARSVLELEGPAGEREGIDLGTSRQGVTVETAIIVRNVGPSSVRIGDVITGCGCLKATYVGPQPLSPGSAGQVMAVVATEGKFGRWHQSLRIAPEGVPELGCDFDLSLDISTGWICETRSVHFGRRLGGQVASSVIRLTCDSRDPGSGIPSVETDVPGQTFRYAVKRGEAKDRSVFDVHLSADVPRSTGFHSGTVIISTTDSRRPRIRIPYDVAVVERVGAYPRIVNFGVVRPGDGPVQRKVVVLPGVPEVSVHVRSVTVEQGPYRIVGGKWVDAGWEFGVTLDPPTQAEIEGVSWTAGAGRLLVEFADPATPPLRVELGFALLPRR